MYRLISIIVLVLISASSIYSQNEVDALRYSQNFVGGTARFVSMGGAFGALGGDLSTTSYNPAGIGVFRVSTLTFTPNFVFNSTSSDFLGNEANQFRTNFNVNNIGVVSSYTTDRTDGLVGVNWAFVYNRSNNFHFNKLMYGNNYNSSITDYFANTARGKAIDDMNVFGERLAWETYSIDNVDSINYIYTSALGNERGEYQERYYTDEGYIGSGDFSVGINVSNKFYWGGTIGIVWTRYTSLMEHTETDVDNNIDNFNSLYYKEFLKTNGTGVNFKTGFIYKINHSLRIGAAVHSPTYFTLHDYYHTFMSANFNDVGYNEARSPDLYQDYELNTPGKFMLSSAYVIGKKVIVSFDYEFLDYSWARYINTYNFYAEDANRAIDNVYSFANNFRLGGEYRISYYSFRAGAGYYGSPFKSNHINSDSYTLMFSGGVGANFGPLFIDLAYINQQRNTKFYMYNPDVAYSKPVNIKYYSNKVMITLGIRF